MSDFMIFDKTKFSKERLIGRGSYGDVSIYRNLANGERYAVKVQALCENSLLEAEVLNKVKCDQIIQCLHCQENDGQLFIVMELADRDLFQHITKNGPAASPLDFFKMAIQLAHGIHRIHQLGFMHLDLKPSNILIKNNQLKIGDFGLAIQISQQQENKKFGTLYIRAPEMLFRGIYNEKVDIWSLGCVLVFIATGNAPFKDREEVWISIGEAIGYKAGTYYLLDRYRKYPEKFPIRAPFPELRFQLGRNNWLALDGCLKTDPISRFDSNQLLQQLEKFCLKVKL